LRLIYFILILNYYIVSMGQTSSSQGPEGPQGPQGPPGEKGDTGSVDWTGFSVTNKEALASYLVGNYAANLKGPIGDKGDKGDTGEQGIPGTGTVCVDNICTANGTTLKGLSANYFNLKNGAGSSNVILKGNDLELNGSSITLNGKLGKIYVDEIQVQDRSSNWGALNGQYKGKVVSMGNSLYWTAGDQNGNSGWAYPVSGPAMEAWLDSKYVKK
jgi:hypothetical protein